MLATQATETDAEFRARITKLIEKARTSKEPMSLKIDGEEQAVLIAPAAFNETWQIVEDEKFYASMRRAIKECDEGKAVPIEIAFARIREKLLKLKADRMESPTP